MLSNNYNGEKILTIDIARGLAALSVFAYHYGVSSVLRKIINWPLFDIVSIVGATYAVPLFFIISGFCIHWSQVKRERKLANLQIESSFNYREYILRRFWRIYPTYLVVLLFSCSLQAMEGNVVSLWDFLIHLLLLQSLFVNTFNSLNLVLWTISVELLFYLLYPFWYYIRKKIGLNRALALGIFVSISSWILFASYLYPYSLPERWFVLNLWGAWLVGAWLAEKFITDRTFFNHPVWWLSGILAILAWIVFANLGLFTGYGQIAKAGVITMLWAYPLSASLLADRKLRSFLIRNKPFARIIRSLQLCGQISYSLYLLHMPLMYVRNLVWDNIDSTPIRTLLWFSGFFIILLISWASYQVFELPYVAYISTRRKAIS